MLVSVEPPFRPEVSSPTDTSNFDVEESDFRPNVRISSCLVCVDNGYIVKIRVRLYIVLQGADFKSFYYIVGGYSGTSCMYIPGGLTLCGPALAVCFSKN